MQHLHRCAILSMDKLDEFECYDYLIEAPLRQRGWEVDTISWRKQGVDWNRYNSVIIRSPWDYQQDAESFLQRLSEIDGSTAFLDNSLSLVRWNINKKYLAELEQKQVKIVPTIWRDDFDLSVVKAAFSTFDTDQIVIKPCVSANADNTWRIKSSALDKLADELRNTFSTRSMMIQPFIRQIVEEGEFSLFYFNGDYSHAILKVPKRGDFRVQEEHGGQLFSITPDKKLTEIAAHAMAQLPEMPLYARLDFVRMGDSYAMMEAELIEPSLYFNMDEQAAERFAIAFVKRMSSRL